LLTRQTCPVIDRTVYSSAEEVKQGAYVLTDFGKEKPQIILMASGSEVGLIVNAGKTLLEKGISSRIVSFPSWELFEKSDAKYKESVFPKDLKTRLAVEAGVAQGWEKYTGDSGNIICMHGFGASAPYQALFNRFGFTVEYVVQTAMDMLSK
jgi:transketolase